MGVVLHQNPPRLSEKPSESLLPPKAELLSACVRLGHAACMTGICLHSLVSSHASSTTSARCARPTSCHRC